MGEPALDLFHQRTDTPDPLWLSAPTDPLENAFAKFHHDNPLIYAEVAQEHGAAVAFVRLPDMIRELRASWNDGTSTSEALVLQRLRKLDLLVIDEVSRHAFFGQGYQHLLDVLDHRVNHQRPTILTTNDDDATLEEILGGATMSRLNGCGGILEFGNDDWRGRDREAA